MKLKITDRKTLENLVIAMLTDIKPNEISSEDLKVALKEIDSPKISKEIFDMRYMTTGGIARKLLDLIYSADYSHGALIIDADIAEDLLGEKTYEDSDAEDAYEIDSNLMGADWNSEQDYGVPRSGLIKE